MFHFDPGIPFGAAPCMAGIGRSDSPDPFSCRTCGTKLLFCSLDEVGCCTRCDVRPVKTAREEIRANNLRISWFETGIQGRNGRLDSNVRTLYHQTSTDNADSIIRSQQMLGGERLGLGGSGGIYFAEMSQETTRKATNLGALLRAQVRLGRVKTISTSGDSSITVESLQAEGYDSVRIPRLGGTEYVAYKSDQVTSIQRVW